MMTVVWWAWSSSLNVPIVLERRLCLARIWDPRIEIFYNETFRLIQDVYALQGSLKEVLTCVEHWYELDESPEKVNCDHGEHLLPHLPAHLYELNNVPLLFVPVLNRVG